MNQIDEALVSGRKKKRRSGFRYSSKKVLQRSRVRRETSKVGEIQLESVRKALSFPCEIFDTVHHDFAPDLVFSLALILLRNMKVTVWS
jgi:hypothetical protein